MPTQSMILNKYIYVNIVFNNNFKNIQFIFHIFHILLFSGA